jgi:hypothetical protein
MEGNDFCRSNDESAGANMSDDEGAGWSLVTLSVFSVSAVIGLLEVEEAAAGALVRSAGGPERIRPLIDGRVGADILGKLGDGKLC